MLFSLYAFPAPVNLAPTYLNFSCENVTSVPVQYMQTNTSPMFFVYPSFGGLGQK